MELYEQDVLKLKKINQSFNPSEKFLHYIKMRGNKKN